MHKTCTMKGIMMLAVSFVISIFNLMGQSQTSLAPISVVAGSNTVLSSVSFPANTVKVSVSASGSFSGILTASASSRKVFITDAKPAGTYIIYIRSFDSSGASTINSFNLIVKEPICSNGNFTGSNQVGILRPNLLAVAIADFDGDGAQDLAAAHEGYNTVSIRMGDGHGDFSGNLEVPVTSHPYALAIGDFNMDGRQDIATSCEGSDLVAIRTGDGNGGFNVLSNVSVGSSPANIAIGDFNKDGKQDFVVANFQGSNVSVRFGDGSGNFTGSGSIATGNYPVGIAVGDFNVDGNQDFVTSNSGQGTLSIRIGNGLGGFSAYSDVPVGFNPYGVCIGDFNEDGKQDLASANFSSNTLSIRLGNGLGAFSGNTEIPVGLGPYSVAIGNFNGDEHKDLAATSYFTNSVSILLGNGRGGFIANPSVPTGTYPVSLAVGDFNGDKRQDIAVANYTDHTISIRLGIIGATPAVSLSNNSPICEGDSLQLSSTGGSTFFWQGPNGFSSYESNPLIPVSSISSAGTYTLIVTDSSNCITISSTNATVNPLPVVDFVLNNDSLCTNDPVQILTGGIPAGGSYSGNGVISGSQFDPGLVGQGNYNLYYNFTDSNSCSNSDFEKMHVVICTGLDHENVTSRIKLFPNPVTDDLNLDLTNVDQETSCELFTQDGRLVARFTIPARHFHKLSMRGMANGVYFLRLLSINSSSYTKLVKSE